MHIKKFLVVFALVSVAALPCAAYAAVFVGGQEYSSGSQSQTNDNLYIGAGMASVGADTNGDLGIAGGNVAVTGKTSGDVLAAGGMLNLLGPVNGDVRAFGGQLTINGHVSGDVVIAGGTVYILPGAVLDGGLTVAAGQVIVDGTVHGLTRVYAGRLTVNGSVDEVSAHVGDKLTLGSGAIVHGALTYSAPQELTMAQGARIVGRITYSAQPSMRINAEPRAMMWGFVATLTAAAVLAALVLAALLLWRWRRQTLEVLQETAGEFWKSAGIGLAYVFLTPIVAILLMISVIGLAPGILLVLAYLMIAIFAKVLAGMFFGAWLAARIKKQTALHLTWVNGLGGVLLLVFVQLIPFVGWAIVFLLQLAVFGTLAHRVQRTLA